MNNVFTSADKLADMIQRRTLPRIEKAFHKCLDKAGKIAVKTAKEMVGHQQPGLWAPLAQSTIEIKRRNKWGLNGNAASPLYATGALRRSIEFEADHGRLIGTIFSNVPYIVYLDKGTARMPPRPLLRPALDRAIPETTWEMDKTMQEALEI